MTDQQTQTTDERTILASLLDEDARKTVDDYQSHRRAFLNAVYNKHRILHIAESLNIKDEELPTRSGVWLLRYEAKVEDEDDSLFEGIKDLVNREYDEGGKYAGRELSCLFRQLAAKASEQFLAKYDEAMQ